MNRPSRRSHIAHLGWLLLVLTLGGCGKDETAAVRKSWDDYYAAVQAKDSQKAVVLVSQSTTEYYERMRKAALEAEEAEVRGMKFLDKIMVLQLRHKMTAPYLRTISGAQVFMVGVQEGWVSKQAVRTSEIADIRVEGSEAFGTMSTNGKTLPFDYRFVKEEGVWKHDLMHVLDAVNDQFTAAMRNRPSNMSPMSEDELVILGLQAESGKEVSPDIWKKPKS